MSHPNPSTTYTKLSNIYYERKAATERACYVCRMPTTTVLATLKSEDFLYACPKHLEDSATLPSSYVPTPDEPMNTLYNHPLRQPSTPTTTTNDGKSVTLLPEPTPSGPTAEDIAKVIKEHEEKEAAARKRKAGATADTKDGKKTGAENAVKEQEKDGSLSLKASSTPSKTTTMATGGQHRRYALHRGIFMMRQRELRAREQGVQAKEKSKGLPQVPRGTI